MSAGIIKTQKITNKKPLPFIETIHIYYLLYMPFPWLFKRIRYIGNLEQNEYRIKNKNIKWINHGLVAVCVRRY
ncbi:hypothetical protein TUM17569_15700 [Klebsiella oxytoca]|nr:hypothetical protein KOJKO3_c0776 [Klebsiella oxytoca]GJK90571.1 hypothetical protein TUM17568_17770 [Klebsiella oxytoca]GJK96109.1 hypothetical protein TUM17569_15700 [Klebsiella oxytoca]